MPVGLSVRLMWLVFFLLSRAVCASCCSSSCRLGFDFLFFLRWFALSCFRGFVVAVVRAFLGFRVSVGLILSGLPSG